MYPKQLPPFYSSFLGLSSGVKASNSERQHDINPSCTLETEGVFEKCVPISLLSQHEIPSKVSSQISNGR